MKLFTAFGGWRLLRRVLKEQQATNAHLATIAGALQSIASAQRLLAQQELGGGGFVTGLPDGAGDSSAIVREGSTNSEVAELVFFEAQLRKTLGRQPTDEEIVASWEDWKAAGGRG